MLYHKKNIVQTGYCNVELLSLAWRQADNVRVRGAGALLRVPARHTARHKIAAAADVASALSRHYRSTSTLDTRSCPRPGGGALNVTSKILLWILT